MLTSRAALLSSGLDPDVAAYASAIVANGGSASQTWLRNVNTFVRGCKSDGIWDSLLDVGLLCGVDNLSGALVKLKTPSGVSRILTNNNFVSGDYTASGSAAGLKGDGTSKYLDTGSSSSLLGGSYALGGYLIQLTAAATGGIVSNNQTTGATTATVVDDFANSRFFTRIGNDTIIVATPRATGAVTALRDDASGGRIVVRDSVGAYTSNAAGALSANSFLVFTRSTVSGFSSGRYSAYWILNSATPLQVSALHSRVNALMATIGASQYYSPNLDSQLGLDPETAEWAALAQAAGG